MLRRLPLTVALAFAACVCRAPAEVTVRAVSPHVSVDMASDPCKDLATFKERRAAADPGNRAALSRWRPPAPVPERDRSVVAAVVRAYLAECGGAEVVNVAQRLIAFPTVSARESAAKGKSFADMAAFLRRY